MMDQIQPGVWFSSKRYMLFVLILASPLSRPVLAFPLHREDVGRGRVMLGPSLEEIADPESVLTYNEIKTAGFHPVSSLFVHHGFTSSAWWYRFNYQAKDLQPGDRLMLSLFNVRLHHVSIWIEEPGKAVRRIDGGHRKPQASYYRDTVFRLPISDQTVTVYLRIFTYGPLRIMPALILEEKLHEEDFVREWIYGVFTGSQLVLAVLNLLIFFLLRDKNYLRFSLFAFSTTLTQLSINGYFSLHFALPWDIDLRLILVFGFASALSLTEFTRGFLETSRLTDRVLRAISIICTLSILISTLIPPEIGMQFLLWFAILDTTLIAIAGIVRYRTGFRSARIFLVAFVPGLAAIFFYMLSRFLPVFPSQLFLPLHHDFAGIMFLAVYSSTTLAFDFALADRVRLLNQDLIMAERERERLRRESANALREERVRINRELHDFIGSDLSALILESRGNSPTVLSVLTQRLSRILNRLRDLVYLNTIDTEFDLSQKINEFLNDIKSDDLSILSNIQNVRLNIRPAFHLHRIFLESLTNCLRHSGASVVRVRLYQRKACAIMTIADNGSGFSHKDLIPGNGLLNIQDRSSSIRARLHVFSQPGRGTIVLLTLPLNP